MDDQKVDPNDPLDAIWCVNSETGERVLIDRIANRRIAHKGAEGETVWEI